MILEKCYQQMSELEALLKGHPIVDGITTLRELLFRAGGPQDKLHLNKIYHNRADLIRFEDDLYTKEILKFKWPRHRYD